MKYAKLVLKSCFKQMCAISRKDAETELRQVFGIDHFYDEQWEVIDHLLCGKRVLMIERTGFGKSLCYQFPTILFDGVTVVFSPLIALMRDQVNSLNAKGIPARCINSEQKPEENNHAIEEALSGKIKILYIAPERQDSQKWIDATRKMRLSMVVVDEAHTISVWGHDFRPSFRRIVNLVNLLPMNMPVLATTATATIRTQRDIEGQLGENLISVRGTLARTNFHLYVVETKSEEEKMIGLSRWMNKLPGTGLLYVGTRVQTEQYERWLRQNKISCVAYNAGLEAERRKEIEQGLINNRWKCVVSTNALGMGIDKPDIRFVIHTQIPASPIHYYQEIGRAGRDGKPTVAILFYNSQEDTCGIQEDYKLPKSFIDNGRPATSKYEMVIRLLKEESAGLSDIMRRTNLKRTPVRIIMADLIEQGICKEVMYDGHKKYEYQFDAKTLDTTRYEELRLAKSTELDKMVDYVFTKEPRMKFLCEYLGDETQTAYSNCDNTNLVKRRVVVSEEDKLRIDTFWENYFPPLLLSNNENNLLNGVAGAYYGTSNVGNAIHKCKYNNGGDFPDFLLKLVLRAYHKIAESKKFDLILYVPPTVSGNLVRNFAHKISSTLNIPISDDLVKTRKTDAQKIFQNAVLKKDNVKGAFALNKPDMVAGKSILLIDDICDSGATLKEIGNMISCAGAKDITPLVIAKTIGGGNL